MDRCFTKPTIHVWCKKILDEQKFVSYTEMQSVVHQWLGQQQESFFASGIQKLVGRWDKMLKNETLMFNVQKGDINLLILFIFSRSYAIYHLRVMTDYWYRKWYAEGWCSMDGWRHNNNVTIKKCPHMFRIKFPTIRIFWIFHIWKTNRRTPFCNLCMEQPS